MKNTERLLLEIGLCPSRRGFAQSAMLLCILRDRPEITSSSAAYALAAERLSATPGQLEHNLRMTIREAWERGDRALLRRLLPWCGDACPPETKDFLFGLAAWLRVGIPEDVLPRSGGNGKMDADGDTRCRPCHRKPPHRQKPARRRNLPRRKKLQPLPGRRIKGSCPERRHQGKYAMSCGKRAGRP